MPVATDVDAYIAEASDVARPILVKLRRIILQASPRLEEAIKWGVPCYSCDGPVIGLAGYRKHVSWGLWKADLVNDPDGLIGHGIRMGAKVASVADVPPAAKLIALIRQVIVLNESGIKAVTPEPTVPDDFAAAIAAHDGAADAFAAFTPARRWQYVNWITAAKRATTRATRIRSAVERIAAGKPL